MAKSQERALSWQQNDLFLKPPSLMTDDELRNEIATKTTTKIPGLRDVPRLSHEEFIRRQYQLACEYARRYPIDMRPES